MFQLWAEWGHTNMKLFMVVGYPWERYEDFDKFEATMECIRSIHRRQNAHLRIKWTPLIPQARTPLAGVTPRYDRRLISRIRKWHQRVYRPSNPPGLYIAQDGEVMSRSRHRLQCMLARGDETVVKKILSGSVNVSRKVGTRSACG